MKKLTLLFLLLVLALTAFALPASAAAPEDLTMLADVAPEGTPSFIAIRTDDGYIEALDGLLARVAEVVPDLRGFTISDLLDTVALNIPGFTGDFDENVRPWLGDSAAAFTLTFDPLMTGEGNMAGGVLVISVTDAAAAEVFLDTLLARDLENAELLKEETEDGILYGNTREPGVFLLTESLLIIAERRDIPALVLPGEDAPSLADSEVFQNALESLPGDDYNIIAYNDSREIVGQALAMVQEELAGQLPFELDMTMWGDFLGVNIAGFTILNGRTLTIDAVTVADAAPEALAPLSGGTVNLDFLDNVPNSAALLIAGEGFGGDLAFLTDAFYLLSDFLVQSGLTPGAMDPSIPEPLADFQLRDLFTFFRFAFRATFGVEVEDVLAWTDGTNANFITVEPGGMMGVQTGMGLLYETTDPAATADFVAGIARNVQKVFSEATFENGVVTVPEDGQIFPGMQAQVVGSNETLYATGTESAVALALGLETDAAPLTDSDIYAYEASLFPANTNSVLLIYMPPVRAAFEAMVAQMEANMDANMGDMDAEGSEEGRRGERGENMRDRHMMMSPEDVEIVRGLLGLLDSSAIASSSSADGLLSVARLTLTLSE